MLDIPLRYAPEGSVILLDGSKHTVAYRGKTGSTLTTGDTSRPYPHWLYAVKDPHLDPHNSPIICTLVNLPDGSPASQFMQQYPEYFI